MIYTVQQNDRVPVIAQRFGITPEQLLTMNPHVYERAKGGRSADGFPYIFPGQILNAPDVVREPRPELTKAEEEREGTPPWLWLAAASGVAYYVLFGSRS